MPVKKITPILKDDICTRFAASNNASEVSRATGISARRVGKIWDALSIEERKGYTDAAQRTVRAAVDVVLDQKADEVAEYAGQLLRVRTKALEVVERMLDSIPTYDPQYLPLLKDVGKVLNDLHGMTTAPDEPHGNSAGDFYNLLKTPSTINIQNNYYGKTEAEHPDTGDKPRRIG